jgi:diadenosine tetraphosphate (Ap4A) HIT family hydrolase
VPDTPECPFCRWDTDPDQQLVHRAERAVFLQNAQQQGALPGSGVIIPIRHASTLFDLTEAELRDTFMLLRTVREWMDTTYQPDGYNVGWNCGAVAGQEIMHAHLHVIPRFKDEPYAGRGIRSWLKQEANRRGRPDRARKISGST